MQIWDHYAFVINVLQFLSEIYEAAQFSCVIRSWRIDGKENENTDKRVTIISNYLDSGLDNSINCSYLELQDCAIKVRML